MLVNSDSSQWTVPWDSLQKGKIWGIKVDTDDKKMIKQPAINQYVQYYFILHAFDVILKWLLHNIAQYYMDITILLNIACNIG